MLEDFTDPELTRRNKLGKHFLYVPANDHLSKQLVEVHRKWSESGAVGRAPIHDLPFTDPCSQGNSMFGYIEGCERGGIAEQIESPFMNGEPLDNPRCVCALFEDPKPPHSRPLHSTQLLPGAYPSAKILDGIDLAEAGRLRGFGGEPARRMILQLLQELGFHTQQHVNKTVGPSELSGPPAAMPAGFMGGFRRF